MLKVVVLQTIHIVGSKVSINILFQQSSDNIDHKVDTGSDVMYVVVLQTIQMIGSKMLMNILFQQSNDYKLNMKPDICRK